MNPGYYLEKWATESYQQTQREGFEVLDQYLTTPPRRILDIGCGFAHISAMFQKKYGTELWLLDGDFSDNNPNATRSSVWGPVDDFLFYNKISVLKEHWDSQGLYYRFVDANNIDIPDDIKFDFVCSWLSCGFHYPLSTYSDLIKKHTDENSVCIFDFRRKTIDEDCQGVKFDKIKRFNEDVIKAKHWRLQVKL